MRSWRSSDKTLWTCRQLALAAPPEFAKEHWLAMTRHWMKMAAAEEAATKQTAAGPASRQRRLSVPRLYGFFESFNKASLGAP
jgi:hypothetical protein